MVEGSNLTNHHGVVFHADGLNVVLQSKELNVNLDGRSADTLICTEITSNGADNISYAMDLFLCFPDVKAVAAREPQPNQAIFIALSHRRSQTSETNSSHTSGLGAVCVKVKRAANGTAALTGTLPGNKVPEHVCVSVAPSWLDTFLSCLSV